MGIITAIWEKYIEFRHEFWKITTSGLISPLLYMVAFGLGLGGTATVDGHPYIQFLIPGIISLTTMNTSFSAVGAPLNIQRLFEHSFEQIIASPTPMWQYVIGQTIGGSLRGVYGGIIIMLISFPFGASVALTPMIFFIMLLNGMVFSALGVLAAILSKTHADVNRFSTFVILPMTFLCNTFFSLDQIPAAFKVVIQLLPLTHASSLLRNLTYGMSVDIVSVAILVAYLFLFLFLTLISIQKVKNL